MLRQGAAVPYALRDDEPRDREATPVPTRTPPHDLDLFLELNREYADRPLVPRPRVLSTAPLLETSRRRAAQLDKIHGLSGKRILEVGCGRGHFSHVLATEFDCDVVGVDIGDYPSWAELTGPRVDLRKHDISQENNAALGHFDLIVTYSVWEHIQHPFAALRAARDLLAPDGAFFLYANLYRGPKASHRYREVFFPWPHLLFTDQVFEDFYVSQGMPPSRPAWVNKLTVAQYEQYFRQLDLEATDMRLTGSPFDEEFYERFSDNLSRYPRYDLSHDFINVTLRRAPADATSDEGPRETTGASAPAPTARDSDKDVDLLRRRLAAIENSTTWRLTAPLRNVVGAAKNARRG